MAVAQHFRTLSSTTAARSVSIGGGEQQILDIMSIAQHYVFSELMCPNRRWRCVMSLRVLMVVVAMASLQGCLAVVVPGSVVGAVSDAITGAEGANCVGPVAKVGDRIRLSDGSIGEIRSLSGTSTRCTQPEFPIRAQLGPLGNAATTQSIVPANKVSSLVQQKHVQRLPAGWVAQPVPEAIRGKAEFYATNLTLEAALITTTVPRESISDFRTYASTRRALQISAVTDPVHSEITTLEINGKKAHRFSVSGKAEGHHFTFLITLVEGDKGIVVLNTWTLAANFEQHRESLERIPQSFAGF